MIVAIADFGFHLNDGDLVRLLDGEGDREERGRLHGHIASCPDCATRFALIERRSSSLSARLARDSLAAGEGAAHTRALPAAPRRRRGRQPTVRAGGLLRAAAVVVALIAVSVVATPIRGWVIQAFAHFAATFGDEPTAPATPGAAAQRSARVSFMPAGAVFRIDVARRQAAGALVLRLTNEPRVMADLGGAPGETALVIFPAGLRVQNSVTSTADIHVTVPASLLRIEVRIEGEPAGTFAPGPAGASAEWRVELAAIGRP